MYSILDFDRESIQNKFKDLKEDLQSNYDSLPETEGCMDNIFDGKKCGAWCCEEQSPSVWFVEFINTLSNFIFKMDSDAFIKLIEDSLNKYLLIDKSSGCVFWDAESKLCSQHETRPINCYFYGVTPPSEFEPRYERLKILNNNVRPQCDLIKIKGGDKYMTREVVDKSFDVVKSIEHRLGVPEDNLDDSPGGSYRSYPEHLLTWLLGEEKMCDLSVVRSSHSIMDKKKLVNSICDNLRQSLNHGKQ